MALIDFKILPGIDKQTTGAGAEQRWVDSDNVRFRYGLPEKVGGWQSPIKTSIAVSYTHLTLPTIYSV